MAAERTFLAWIRTGLALMGFGFVVARFGLFLHEMASLQPEALPPGHGYSLWIGISLVALGVLVNILAAVNHSRYLRALSTSGIPPHLNTQLGNVVAAALAAIGVATVVYLLAIR
jgi:putative membrane protein